MKPAPHRNRVLTLLAGSLLASGALVVARPASVIHASWRLAQDAAKTSPTSASQPPARVESRRAAKPETHPTLRDVADSFGFHIGSIMQVKMFDNPVFREVLGREFNAFISFVFMKQVEPEEGHYDFSGMDRDMQFAREHNQKLFGSTPIYRAGVAAPDWLAPQHFGNFGRSPAEFDKILEDYIEDYQTAEQIASTHKYDLELVRSVVRMVEKAEYKRQQAAPGLKITAKAFGVGRRFPIAARHEV